MNGQSSIQTSESRFKAVQKFLIFVSVVMVIVVIFTTPRTLPFWPFTTTDIVTLLTNFALIALIIERAVEVILGVTRAKEKRIMKTKQRAAKRSKDELVKALDVMGYGMKGSSAADGKMSEMLELMKSQKAESKEKDEEISQGDFELAVFTGQTKIISMIYAFAFGVLASALGFRILEPLVDPDIFQKLEGFHKAVFDGFDTLITGALLGGGSNGIHKILDTFLSWFDKARESLKEIS